MVIRIIFFISCLFFGGINPVISQPSSQKLRALYNSLDEKSAAQHLAFYRLYGETPEGQKALQHAWLLLTETPSSLNAELKLFPDFDLSIDAIMSLVHRQPSAPLPDLSEAQLRMIETLGQTLLNRKLKGYGIQNEQYLIHLPPEDIDLARGLLLSQWGNADLVKIRSYEAVLDLIALQIRAKFAPGATAEDKIRSINAFIFEEMKFKFPPHSLYAKDIDVYTFLPSVLDSRRGVCLGVSILYLCIAQRLGITLEMVTPPGHIYIRYHEGDKLINIETTARGIHLDSEEYLGVNTRSLQMRNIKEVIGLAHFNEASVHWQQQDFAKALQSYQKAALYLPEDQLLTELTAYTHLILGDEEKGSSMLKTVQHHLPDYAVSKSSLAEDYLTGATDGPSIKTVFMHVDETRQSILKKKSALEEVLHQHPKFREGLLSLAICWLQLHRSGEALEILQRYHELDNQNAEVEYYLTILNAERENLPQAWKHLHQTEKLLQQREYTSKTLVKLRKSLTSLCKE